MESPPGERDQLLAPHHTHQHHAHGTPPLNGEHTAGLIDDGERMIPEFHHDSLIYAEHIARYVFACQFVQGKRVLDVASGAGYGSEALWAAGAATVVGVDYSAGAVRYSASRYGPPPSFVVGDAQNLPLRDGQFDVVVSFETIEHVPDHLRMLEEVRRVLRPGGLFVVSTPNKGIYEEGNPFHLKEFTFAEFGADLNKYFGNVALLAQDNWIGSAVLSTEEMRRRDVPLADAKVYKGMAKDAERTLYVVALCSDAPLPQAAQQVALSDVAQVQKWAEETAREAKEAIRQRDAAIAAADEQIAEKDAALMDRDALIAEREATARYLWVELEGIRGSLGYRLLGYYRRMVRAVFPQDSVRGIPYRAFRKGVRLSIRSAGVIRREGLRSFARKALVKVGRRLRRGHRATGPRAAVYDIPALDKHIRPLAFPEVAEPRVSIVIPVYNKALFTFNCLKSILENSGDVPYEVIVVDDCSTDETQEMLGTMRNVRSLRNEQNKGFLGTCNYGMTAARGEYVLLLNNDTHVLKGWLAALLRTIDGDPSVGLVGAKLIYPTGKLQEAGGIVWSDASSYAYGRDDDPAKPEYNFVREVDYCSAACVIVRRNLVEEIGGFDTRFAPAYYEDTDLAFTVRCKGYRVLYQPAAEIIHREGTSSGGEMSQRLQVTNRPVFLDKWREVLAKEHFPPGTSPLVARDRRRGKRVMVIDYHVPTWDRGGGELRMFSLLKLLHGLGYSTTLLPADLVRIDPYTEEMQQLGIEVLYGPVKLDEHGPHIGTVIVSRPEVAQHYAPIIRRVAPQAVLIYDTVDLHWVREARRAEVENSDAVRRESERLKGMELWAARASDLTLVVSPVEKEILEKELPALKVSVIPNVHPVHGRRKEFHEREGLLFIGYYPHLPNRDAMLYFIREVLPIVKREIPDVRLYAVGPEPGPELEKLASDNVIVTGWVKDLEPYLDGCRVSVSPLRYGAGIKGKIGEALGYGLPVVTTPMGAEGMGLIDGEDALIAGGTEEFARHVVALYRDQALWQRLSDGGLAFVERSYSPEVVSAKLKEMVESARGGLVGRSQSQCNICGSRAGFSVIGGHPKEGFECSSCGSVSRDRMLMSALGICLGQHGPMKDWRPDPSVIVVETSGFRAHPAVLHRKFRYANLAFHDHLENGLLGDVQRLPLRDGSVGAFISSDVFEHVRDDMMGFTEVHRVLKDGGYFVLHVPALGEGEKTRVLVDVSGSEDVYLAPPEYHSPHSLVYRYYGNDLAGRLASCGFQVLLYRACVPFNQIGEQTLIIAQKSARLSLGQPPSG